MTNNRGWKRSLCVLGAMAVSDGSYQWNVSAVKVTVGPEEWGKRNYQQKRRSPEIGHTCLSSPEPKRALSAARLPQAGPKSPCLRTAHLNSGTTAAPTFSIAPLSTCSLKARKGPDHLRSFPNLIRGTRHRPWGSQKVSTVSLG